MTSSGHRIFVSHSHLDNAFGMKLAQDLRRVLKDENALFYDVLGGLHGGETWWEKIIEEITARDVFLLVLSPDSMNSRWIRREINIALNQNKLIIPLLYRPCKIRADLETIQIISFVPPKSYDEAFLEVLRALGLPTHRPVEKPESVRPQTHRPVVRLGTVSHTIGLKETIIALISITAIIIGGFISGLWNNLPVIGSPTHHTTNLISTPTPRPTLKASPSPFELNINSLYMAWRDTEGDQRIHLASFNNSGWSAQQSIPSMLTSTAPSLAIFQNKLYIAWRGIEGDQGIYWASFDGSSWSAQHSIPGVGTSNTPSLAIFQDKLYMVWRGTEGDQGIYWASFDGSSWSAQHSMPTMLTSTAPSLAIFQDKLYMAWKASAGDQRIFWASFDGSSWSAQKHIPGIGTSNAPSLTIFQDKLYMAWRGIEGDQGIYWASFDGSSWSAQKHIPGIGTTNAPTLATF